MYVDKKLQGLQAVQTLSRLNRTCSGKEDTFVLDFVNEAEEVQEAFRPYYEKTEIEERVDDPDDKTKAVKDHLVHGGFMAPEIAARIDRVYVFRHLSKELMIEMIEMKISSFGKLYDVEIVEVAPEIFLRILQRSDKVRESGMREINRIIDKEIGGAVTQAKQNRLRQIRLLDDEGDILVEECDD